MDNNVWLDDNGKVHKVSWLYGLAKQMRQDGDHNNDKIFICAQTIEQLEIESKKLKTELDELKHANYVMSELLTPYQKGILQSKNSNKTIFTVRDLIKKLEKLNQTSPIILRPEIPVKTVEVDNLDLIAILRIITQ